MARTSKRVVGRLKRKARIRRRVRGTAECPRLCVFRSLRYTYAQVVSDDSGEILFSVSSKALATDAKESSSAASVETAKSVGIKVAELAKEHKISRVVFDRNGYMYHGRVAAVADGAREGGLEF